MFWNFAVTLSTVDLNCVNHRSRNSGTLPAWIAWDFREDEQRYSLSRFIDHLMVGLSWNYTRCLSSSSMVHLIVAWLLLIAFALQVLLGSNVRRECEFQAEHDVKSFD